jgi:hypothetical protein
LLLTIAGSNIKEPPPKPTKNALRQFPGIAEEEERVSAFSTFGKALRASIILLGCVVGVAFTCVSIIAFMEEPLPLLHLAKQEYEALYIYTVILYYVAGLFINLVAVILSIFTL